MFFPRLRRRAKWIFLVLALVFALGFIGFGVGAGGSGIGNFISDFIHGNTGTSGTSVSGARAKVAKNPRDATAQLELANALTTTGDLTGAVSALDAYLKLRPKDTDALQQQAGLWARLAER